MYLWEKAFSFIRGWTNELFQGIFKATYILNLHIFLRYSIWRHTCTLHVPTHSLLQDLPKIHHTQIIKGLLRIQLYLALFSKFFEYFTFTTKIHEIHHHCCIENKLCKIQYSLSKNFSFESLKIPLCRHAFGILGTPWLTVFKTGRYPPYKRWAKRKQKEKTFYKSKIYKA